MWKILVIININTNAFIITFICNNIFLYQDTYFKAKYSTSIHTSMYSHIQIHLITHQIGYITYYFYCTCNYLYQHYFCQKNIIHHTITIIHITSHSLIYTQDTLSLIHYIHHIPSHQIVCGGRHRSLHSISSLSYPLTLTLLWCHLEKRLQS